MIDFSKYRALTFDCYGTLIDWERGITELVQPWLLKLDPQLPSRLLLSSFALMQAKFQQVRPTLLYPDVLRRTWGDIEGTFGWPVDPAHADAFADSVGSWPPFADTVDSLRYFERSYRLAILSNVDNVSLHKTLKLLQVPFTLTVTAEDADTYKPSLALFNRAIAMLDDTGISRNEILHIGQSKHHDINPGRELGLTTVWVNRRHDQKGSGATLATEADPHLTVTSLAELVALHKAQVK
jgi:2-haloacid dehalogenase/putative hydrolase of the HAD superfamily